MSGLWPLLPTPTITSNRAAVSDVDLYLNKGFFCKLDDIKLRTPPTLTFLNSVILWQMILRKMQS